MLTTRIALIDQTRKIRPAHLSAVAAAIQIQVNRDLARYWHVPPVSITTLSPDAKVPNSVWPVIIVDSLAPGEGGYHWAENNQPYSKVLNGRSWYVAVSHEVNEMIVDPWGNRLQSGPKIELSGSTQTLSTTEMVDYLVEIDDPCETHGHVIDGVGVSDFITPDYYNPSSHGPFDFMGRIKAPLQVLPGGYISWFDRTTNDIMQLVWVDPTPAIVNLGSASGSKSLKEFVDSKRNTIVSLAQSTDHPATKLAESMNFKFD